MAEVDPKDFEARINSMECGQDVRDVVAYLRHVAEQAGDDVVSRAHETTGGWGIAYKRGKRVFCQLDPKCAKGHVCVSIPGADASDLKSAGTVHNRKNARPWIDIRDLRGAKLLEPLILRAYFAAGVALDRRVKNGCSNVDASGLRAERTEARGSSPVVTQNLDPQGRDGARLTGVRKELRERGFVHAGAIRPVDRGKSCRAELKPLNLLGSVVYGLLVGDQLKKCGDTGRKNATLERRMQGCANTLNQILRGALAGPFTENFKRLAPKVIEANQEIEVWAREATAAECRHFQRELNGKYDTIRTGWANRLE